ncbi:uncharacterized protein RCO7_01486 [Rhynchosporium graminicola]|uniref:CHRD domain-containing protein n=1 Tax=Rhynchosporium graminicola TaxID=2792576 RepID=A0A1E1K3T0_9HELO|nr:uncharacterized protein RCO7_01486 [Rhynchosporium commune]
MQYSYALVGLAAAASAQEYQFTSTFNVTATPDQVVSNAGLPAPGPAAALGQFNYAIDSKNDIICYDITLVNFVGAYQSPAKTATHIHEGAEGKAGPPRIAFPNPVGDDNLRKSSGCLIGPFTTGIKMADNVTDTGAGFRLAQIEANPAGFFTDSHSALFAAGVVRGQLDQEFEFVDTPEAPTYPNGTGNPTDGHELVTATYTKTLEYTITSCKAEVTDCPYKTKPLVTKTVEVYTTVCPASELSTATLYFPGKPGKPAETHPAGPAPPCPGCPVAPAPPAPTPPCPGPGCPAAPAPPAPAGPCPGPGCPVAPAPPAPAGPCPGPGCPVAPAPPAPAGPCPGPGCPVAPAPPAPAGPCPGPGCPGAPIVTYPVNPTPALPTKPAGTGVTPPYVTFTGAAASNKVGGLLVVAGLAAALL